MSEEVAHHLLEECGKALLAGSAAGTIFAPVGAWYFSSNTTCTVKEGRYVCSAVQVLFWECTTAAQSGLAVAATAFIGSAIATLWYLLRR